MATRWTKEQDGQLTGFVAERKSKSQIAQAMHLTSSAVEARCRRLGLTFYNPIFWTPDREAKLRKMVASGAPSVLMADELGTTRGAVFGKCERLGLSIRVPPHGGANVVKIRSKGSGSSTASAIALLAPLLASSEDRRPAQSTLITGPHPDSLNLKITDRGFRRFNCCKWPTGGEMAETTFCCRPTDNATYCPDHAARAYNIKPPSGAKRDRRNLAKTMRRFG